MKLVSYLIFYLEQTVYGENENDVLIYYLNTFEAHFRIKINLKTKLLTVFHSFVSCTFSSLQLK